MNRPLSDYIIKNRTVTDNTKDVTEEEFRSFIDAYPRKLVRDVCGISDPPAVSYNDFELGVWPFSIVASTFLYDKNPGEYFYEPPEKRQYSIVTNHEELLAEAQRLTKDYIKEGGQA
nr:MAG TPA: hypothetical protein [Caudoviricetes sp.]